MAGMALRGMTDGCGRRVRPGGVSGRAGVLLAVLFALAVQAGEAAAWHGGAAGQAPGWTWILGRGAPPRDYAYRVARPASGRTGEPPVAPEPGEPSAAGKLRAAAAGMATTLARRGGGALPDGSLVAVASFVSLNDLYRTSSLGRYLGEEMLAGLHRAGIAVVDVRKTVGLLVRRKGGEYGLSRDIAQIDPVRRARAVVVGTYVAEGGEVMVNARMLDNRDGRVIATAGAVFGVDRLVRAMLADEGDGDLLPRQDGGAMVRIRQVAER